MVEVLERVVVDRVEAVLLEELEDLEGLRVRLNRSPLTEDGVHVTVAVPSPVVVSVIVSVAVTVCWMVEPTDVETTT